MLFEKLESKLDYFSKYIPPNCIEIGEWADTPKYLPKIYSLKVKACDFFNAEKEKIVFFLIFFITADIIK